jgi:hypothetical protein
MFGSFLWNLFSYLHANFLTFLATGSWYDGDCDTACFSRKYIFIYKNQIAFILFMHHIIYSRTSASDGIVLAWHEIQIVKCYQFVIPGTNVFRSMWYGRDNQSAGEFRLSTIRMFYSAMVLQTSKFNFSHLLNIVTYRKCERYTCARGWSTLNISLI